MNPFKVVGYTDDYDLRKVTKNRHYLKMQERNFGMKNGEAIIFVNKKFTLFRIIWKWNKGMWLLQPESGEGKKLLSVYLRVSEELARLSINKVTVEMDKVIKLTEKRIKRMRKRKKMRY